MTKLAHYCCDPRHAEPCQTYPFDAHPDCDPNHHFYGTEPQAKAKLARVKKAEQAKETK